MRAALSERAGTSRNSSAVRPRLGWRLGALGLVFAAAFTTTLTGCRSFALDDPEIAAAIRETATRQAVALNKHESGLLAATLPEVKRRHVDGIDADRVIAKILTKMGDAEWRAEVRKISKDVKLVEVALSQALADLDPYSTYMNPMAYDNFKVRISGKFGGLGIEVTMKDNAVEVVSPIDDTPASRAGMQPGDRITHVDGESLAGFSLSDAVRLMRGDPGTKIELTVEREGEDKPLQVTIVRDIITIRSVRHRAEGKIGYIRITTFNLTTARGVLRALDSLQEDLGESMQGLVIDLRNNPGGSLSQSVDVSDIFLPDGEIVSVRGRNALLESRYDVKDEDSTGGVPIVVLINGGSASASEIVAGAMQDHGRAVVMGTRSFGKGTVQTILPIPDYGALRLTTARYYTPAGRSFEKEGILPDYWIAAREREAKKPANDNEKPAQDEAKNDGNDEAKNDGKGDGKADRRRRARKAASDAELPAAAVATAADACPSVVLDKAEDPQLACALDYLRRPRG